MSAGRHCPKCGTLIRKYRRLCEPCWDVAYPPIPRVSQEERRIARAKRAEAFAALYRSGKTLQEIGALHGLTRERVRQLLASLGIDGADGGIHLSAKWKKDDAAYDLAIKREKNSLEKHGCTYEQYQTLLRLPRRTKYSGPTSAFQLQRNNAMRRGIAWEFKLWDWWQVWQESGKWGERGRGQGYVMARRGDEGAYAPGNVFITSAIDNCSNAPKKKKHDLPLGVQFGANGFTAQRMLHGEIHHLGTHRTPEAAHNAYVEFAPVPALPQSEVSA